MSAEGDAWRSNRVWEAQSSRPYEGTERHPQGRLFNPSGGYRGDPWMLSPEQWLKSGQAPPGPAPRPTGTYGEIGNVSFGPDTDFKRDTIAWHASESSQLPRYDQPEGRQIEENYDYEEGEEDYATDAMDRPMASYGSAVGMHFGTIKAAADRSTMRPYIHPVRIPGSTVEMPEPRKHFMTEVAGGGVQSGAHKSGSLIRNEAGEQFEDTRWSDAAANYAGKATDLVESGKTLPYRNMAEHTGSTSYRTLPETTRTWSEDVLGARHPGTGMPPQHEGGPNWASPDTEHGFRNVPHPALVHLAERGFNPVVRSNKSYRSSYLNPQQMRLMPAHFDIPGSATPSFREDELAANAEHERSFNRGEMWELAKPLPEHDW